MNIIEAINKSQVGDILYNQGPEPNMDYEITVTTKSGMEFYDGWCKSDLLKHISLDNYFTFSDGWVIKRKIEPEIFEVNVESVELDESSYHEDIVFLRMKINQKGYKEIIKCYSKFRSDYNIKNNYTGTENFNIKVVFESKEGTNIIK